MPVSSVSEVSRLATVFAALRDRLAVRTAERERAEAQLRQAYDDLELRVRARSAELSEANGRLVAEVAERQLVETALRHSEEQFRAAAEGSPDSFFLLKNVRDTAGRIVDFEFVDLNSRSLGLLGLPRDEIIGQRLCELIPINRTDGYFDKYVQVFETGVTLDEEFAISAPEIAASWLHHQVVPLIDGVAITSRDVTARKRAEEERERLLADLRSVNEQIVTAGLRTEAQAAEIEVANRELRLRATELEATNGELEAFSYTVSHDLRAPLRAIIGFSKILVNEHAPQLTPEASRYLHLASENATQMGHLIDDLLSFSRLVRAPLTRQIVKLAPLVRRTLKPLLAEQTGRVIEVTIGDLPDVQADPVLLGQVMENLLANALKFTGKRDAARIEVGARRDGEETVYFVRDNGVGFDMRYVDKLFGVFQRLHPAADYEGTGVGLAIVQRIIHRHGGHVWAEAEIDCGATFYFSLGQTPTAALAPADETAPIASTSLGGN